MKLIAGVALLVVLIVAGYGGYWYRGARTQSDLDSSLQRVGQSIATKLAHAPQGPGRAEPLMDPFHQYVQTIIDHSFPGSVVKVVYTVNRFGATNMVASAGSQSLPPLSLADVLDVVRHGTSRFLTVHGYGETFREYVLPAHLPSSPRNGQQVGLIQVFQIEPSG